MSLFNLPVTHEEKEVSHHPWEKTVKDLNANKIKYAHNSVYNPPYPKKKKEKKRAPEKDRVKFTVIGNRLTKEFIYCAKMVQGMHKYRSEIYDAPVIRGVTSVEWPSVLNNLKIEYGGLAYCLRSQVAVLHNGKFLGGENELRDTIESQYVYHLTIDYHKESVNQFARFVRASGLYTDIVPITCENFLRLSKNRKGGYSGTPIHRIVKDGWIQCGGFGLKSTAMDCENFIVPLDRRGVLAMANDGRHVDCSTQFFVLLQPAPWMQSKYVAFGQLVDGDSILKSIEEVPTWYESPLAEILIHKTGILNVDCQDIMINPGAKAYIAGHIDDLVTIGEIFYEALMEQVFLEIEFRHIARMEQEGEGEEEQEKKGEGKEIKSKEDIRATQRFMRRKDEMQSQLHKLHGDSKRASVTHSEAGDSKRESTRQSKAPSEKSNKEFDVDVYEYESEEYAYSQACVASVSEPPKEKRPFYIPLTDVPYPDEVSSEYDLKKFLKGDYCLESDLAPVDATRKVIIADRRWSYASDIFNFFNEDEDDSRQGLDSLTSDEEDEIKKYLKDNVDRLSFAGAIIKGVAKGVGMVNLFENYNKSELLTDEVLRRFRVASVDMRAGHDKRVSISIPLWDKGIHTKIRRRQTGFIKAEDLAKIKRLSMAADEPHVEEEEETEQPFQWTDETRKVSVSISMPEGAIEKHQKIKRRQTGFVRPQDLAKIRIFSTGDDEDETEAVEDVPDTNRRKFVVDSGQVTIAEHEISDVKPGDIEKLAGKQEENMNKEVDKPKDMAKFLTAAEEEKKREENEEPQDIAKLFTQDDDAKEHEEQSLVDLSSTRSNCTSAVSINEPVGAKEKHDQIKRRQTGFVSQEQMARLRQLLKDQELMDDEDDESEANEPVPDLGETRSKGASTVSIKEPFGSKEVHEQIKRRQTGFVKPEELTYIREFVKDSNITVRKAYDEIEEEEEKQHISDLSATRSQCTSVVSINEPFGSKEVHDKIKRRQTGFVKPEELAKIREFVEDQDIYTGYDKDEEDEKKKLEVKIDDNVEEKYNRIKRRQTSFVKSNALSKIREVSMGDEEDNIDEVQNDQRHSRHENEYEAEKEPVTDLSGTRSRTSIVSIHEPFGSKEVHDKIKRRQTGFVKPEELANIREFVKDQDIDTGFELEKEEEKKPGVKIDDNAEEKYNRIKRRQTSFAKSGALSKIREFSKGDDEEENIEEEGERDFGNTRLHLKRNEGVSTVSITEPEDAKEHREKIKRRQTGFVSPEQLTKIREFTKDLNEEEEEEDEKTVVISEPEGAKQAHDKIKRRQTGFVKPQEVAKLHAAAGEEDEDDVKNLNLTAPTNTDKPFTKSRQTSFARPHELHKVREFTKDEVVDEEVDLSKTRRSQAPSVVSINEPEGAKEVHDKIKRRQTGFVSSEQLTKIREFVKDIAEEEENEDGDKTSKARGAVIISESEGAKSTPEKINRRPTGFLNQQEVAKLLAAAGNEDEEGDTFGEEKQTSFAGADELHKDEEVDLGKTRSQGPSVVSINEPAGAKEEHDKIKRRQTGFVSPEQLTKIREFVKDIEDGEDDEDGATTSKARGAVNISDPEGAKRAPDKIKRRQTGFIKPQEVAKLRAAVDDDDGFDEENFNDTAPFSGHKPATKSRQTSFAGAETLRKYREFTKDEVVDEEVDLSKTRSQGPSVVSINEPQGAKEVHDKIKRRQTGFVSSEQLTKIREFVKDIEDEEDDENGDKTSKARGTVNITEPEGAKSTPEKIKRRQTGFVSTEELTKIREFMKDEENDKQSHLESRQAGPSTVLIKEPEGAKSTHDKIKRRQTGFSSPEQLTKIREFMEDEMDEGEDKAGYPETIVISEPEGAKTTHDKIKRRQTRYFKAEDAAILSAEVEEEEDDEDKDNFSNKDRHGVVEIREPDGSKGKSEKIKRRQTGFFKPKDLQILGEDEETGADDCDKENNPDTINRKVSVSINVPESTDKQSHIKRRQTGFVRPQDVVKLRKLDYDTDKEDYDDDDDDDGDAARNSRDTNSKSNRKEGSAGAEYSDDITALFVTFKGRKQGESKNYRKVRIAPTSVGSSSKGKKSRPSDSQESDTEVRRSVLTRLYDEVKADDDILPTLKDYRPLSESQQQKNILLTFSQNQLAADDEHYEKYFRPSLTVEDSFDQVLNLQHGKKVTRKISSDYVNTIDQIERKTEHSIRSVEYAKTRPSMTVAEYQKKNKLYQEERKLSGSGRK